MCRKVIVLLVASRSSLLVGSSGQGLACQRVAVGSLGEVTAAIGSRSDLSVISCLSRVSAGAPRRRVFIGSWLELSGLVRGLVWSCSGRGRVVAGSPGQDLVGSVIVSSISTLRQGWVIELLSVCLNVYSSRRRTQLTPSRTVRSSTTRLVWRVPRIFVSIKHCWS